MTAGQFPLHQRQSRRLRDSLFIDQPFEFGHVKNVYYIHILAT